MESWSLTNAIRLNPSYLGVETILSLLSQSQSLHTQSLVTLKEIGRVVGVNCSVRKAELVVDITTKVLELRSKPLTLLNLQREAMRANIVGITLTYQDLRVVLGYEKMVNAGVIYFPRDSRDYLYRILRDTVKGSWQRMVRLKQSYSDIVTVWNILPQSNEQLHHTLTFCEAEVITDANRNAPLVYVDGKDDVGEILLNTIPCSFERKRLLYAYDPSLISQFKSKHHLTQEQDLMGLVALHTPDPDDGESYIYEYTNDRDPLLRVLATTEANTLLRYVEITSLGVNPRLEELCIVPRLPDQRPCYIQDTDPQNYAQLSLAVLQSLAIREGLSGFGDLPELDKDELIDGLTIAYVCPCFRRTNLVENTIQTQTSLLTDLVDVEQGQLYSFGMRDGTGSNVYYERDELVAKFMSEQAFIDIHTNKRFETPAIKRLYVLSMTDMSPGGIQFQLCLRNLLLLVGNMDAQEQDLVREVRHKPEVRAVFELLFEAGFYMRRWNGNRDRYPLLASETEPEIGLASNLEEERLFGRVNDALERFRVAVEALPEATKARFWSLRLKNYVRSGYYSPSLDSDDGKSIRDRFELVCQGNNPEVVINSCIRLTSGWFIFTALYYVSLIWNENLRGARPHELEFVS